MGKKKKINDSKKEYHVYGDNNIIGDNNKISTTKELKNSTELETFINSEFLFERIENFVTGNKSGYFLLRGILGSGKTTFCKKLSEERNYPLFNVDRYKNSAYLLNEIRQHYNVPERGEQVHIKDIFSALNPCPTKENPAILIIDGIEELKDLTSFEKSTILHLPDELPPYVYVIMTSDSEKGKGINFPSDFEYHDLKNSDEDLGKHFDMMAKKYDLRAYMLKHSCGISTIKEQLVKHSKGSFEYINSMLGELGDSDSMYFMKSPYRLPHNIYVYRVEKEIEDARREANKKWGQIRTAIISTAAALAIIVGSITIHNKIEASNQKKKEKQKKEQLMDAYAQHDYEAIGKMRVESPELIDLSNELSNKHIKSLLDSAENRLLRSYESTLPLYDEALLFCMTKEQEDKVKEHREDSYDIDWNIGEIEDMEGRYHECDYGIQNAIKDILAIREVPFYREKLNRCQD